MSDVYSSFVKFTYTIVDPKGVPNQKCYLLNLNFIVNIESGNNNDIKIYMSNNKIIDINPIALEDGINKTVEWYINNKEWAD